VTRFIDHLYTQIVTTRNFNSRTSLHTIKITLTAAHKKIFCLLLSFPGNGSQEVPLLTSLAVLTVW
jgi:hypothetical protein